MEGRNDPNRAPIPGQGLAVERTGGDKRSTAPRARKKISRNAPEPTLLPLAVRKAIRDVARARFGDELLPINPETGKRWSGTGRSPTSGTRSPIVSERSDLPPVNFQERWESKRQRAARVRERMQRFSSIYNSAWMVRDSWHGQAQRREYCMRRFIAVLLSELKHGDDAEALIFAVADALTLSPHGVPWEG